MKCAVIGIGRDEISVGSFINGIVKFSESVFAFVELNNDWVDSAFLVGLDSDKSVLFADGQISGLIIILSIDFVFPDE